VKGKAMSAFGKQTAPHKNSRQCQEPRSNAARASWDDIGGIPGTQLKVDHNRVAPQRSVERPIAKEGGANDGGKREGK